MDLMEMFDDMVTTLLKQRDFKYKPPTIVHDNTQNPPCEFLYTASSDGCAVINPRISVNIGASEKDPKTFSKLVIGAIEDFINIYKNGPLPGTGQEDVYVCDCDNFVGKNPGRCRKCAVEFKKVSNIDKYFSMIGVKPEEKTTTKVDSGEYITAGDIASILGITPIKLRGILRKISKDIPSPTGKGWSFGYDVIDKVIEKIKVELGR